MGEEVEAMNQMIKDRNKALRTMDERKIRKYAAAYGEDLSKLKGEVFWAAVHKARYHCLSGAEKALSADWLKEHGYSTSA